VDEGFVTVGSIMGSRIYGCSSESGGEVRIPAKNSVMMYGTRNAPTATHTANRNVFIALYNTHL